MSTPKIHFLKSAVLPQDFPPPNRPEIALIGRSNAGKSSLLNSFAGTKAARVSQSPGKTRLLNFFDFGKHYRFVDMPGYGFAARAQNEIDSWQKMIVDYLKSRENLVGIVLIMDAAREWQAEEQWIKESAEKLDLRLLLVLNKADKFNRAEQTRILDKMRKAQLALNVHLVSAEKNTGIDALEKDIFDQLVRGVDA